MSKSIVSLHRYIEDELGFATTYYNDAYLDRRITARMHRTDDEGYADYLRTLRGDDEEQDALLDSLSINVTSFFRNPNMWASVRSVLRAASEAHEQVRLWSAPCSDGREPYSMAMLALEDPTVDADRVEIVGSDISEEALEVARAGRYETTNTTDIEEELAFLDDYTRYLDRDSSVFAVAEPVRDLVRFEHRDLIQDDPPGTFELVMCRNLLIYIDPDFKEPILETLDSALVDGGYLVIGMTETLPPSYGSRYESVERGTRIHQKVS